MTLGNNQVCNVKGIGSIRLRMQDQSVRLLTDVGYIPKVKRNLVSLGSLEANGCSFFSSGGKMLVKKGKNVVMTADRRGSLYQGRSYIKGIRGICPSSTYFFLSFCFIIFPIFSIFSINVPPQILKIYL